MEQKLCTLKNLFTSPMKKQTAWQKFILPVELKNMSKYRVHGDRILNPVDYVFVVGRDQSFDVFNNVKKQATVPTDYAVANGFYQGFDDFAKYRGQSIPVWQRAASTAFTSHKFDFGAKHHDHPVSDTKMGIVPALHLDLDAIIQTQKAQPDFGKIDSMTNEKGKVLYHTIEFGAYPQRKVNNDYKFDELLKLGQMELTGKKYTGYFQKDGKNKFAENWEYEYEGKRYVYVNNYAKCRTLENWHDYQTRGFNFSCFQVEPIKWIIENWQEMPQAINPNGNGKAKFMAVHAENALMAGIPFATNEKDVNRALWQNSTVRGFLNRHFIQEAFGRVNDLTNQFEQEDKIQDNHPANEFEMGL